MQPSDCEYFGFEYIRSEKRKCVTGEDVLCGAPWLDIHEFYSPANEINVMTYNIYDLGYRVSHVGQVQRTCRIPGTIAKDFPDVDVIVFEEVFMFGCWPEKFVFLRELLSFYGFSYFTRNVGERTAFENSTEPDLKFTNGGVMIASRYPITDEAQHVYDALEPGSYQQKGVVYAEIVKTVASERKVYHVFGTHSQHDNSTLQQTIREQQAHEFRSFINSRNISSSEPVILAGDFNMDFIKSRWEVFKLLAILDAAAPPVVGEITPTWSPENQLVSSDYDAQYLDYVLYDLQSHAPLNAYQRIVKPRADNEFQVCLNTYKPHFVWPADPSCPEIRVISDLSDHYAVIGKFVY